ncbi:MAG: SOS response-associated peptidase [SAR202 cluster bacterium]|mgnify:CR=1 FL=1|nr:SOS response-associated peptidase [SAR202 cluster bacterium]|tara:strand:- start:244 stop:915 length:672 start_codon:yes stop_codon:yes gene_type:complete
MCGRYSLVANLQDLEKRFSFSSGDLSLQARFNVAPTQSVLSITNNGSTNEPRFMKWGLIPRWSKDTKIASNMINARAETIDQKASFKEPFLKRRCLIPADGFYEWARNNGQKVPMRITLKSGEPFGLAGLWETWVSNNTDPITTCTIITTKANELMAPIHHRMPVILPKESEDIWLDPDNQDPKLLKELLAQYPSSDMEAYTVSTLVNSPGNDSPDVIARYNP